MNTVVVAAVIFVILVFVLGLVLGRWLGEHRQTTPPPSSLPLPKIPDQFDAKGLGSTLGLRLAGTPADGSSADASSSRPSSPQKVIWIDQGDEVLVHLDSVRTQILDRTLLVSVDLETDQTGRAPLVVVLALGSTDDPAGLVAVTDDLPRGNGILASRWGSVLQEAVWASLLGLATDHASERGLAPRGIAASTGTLRLRAAEAPSAVGASPVEAAAR